jgi:hypothetical protein
MNLDLHYYPLQFVIFLFICDHLFPFLPHQVKHLQQMISQGYSLLIFIYVLLTNPSVDLKFMLIITLAVMNVLF